MLGKTLTTARLDQLVSCLKPRLPKTSHVLQSIFEKFRVKFRMNETVLEKTIQPGRLFAKPIVPKSIW
jgi:hypothetical protein